MNLKKSLIPIKNIGDRDSARPKGRHIMYIWFIIKR